MVLAMLAMGLSACSSGSAAAPGTATVTTTVTRRHPERLAPSHRRHPHAEAASPSTSGMPRCDGPSSLSPSEAARARRARSSTGSSSPTGAAGRATSRASPGWRPRMRRAPLRSTPSRDTEYEAGARRPRRGELRPRRRSASGTCRRARPRARRTRCSWSPLRTAAGRRRSPSRVSRARTRCASPWCSRAAPGPDAASLTAAPTRGSDGLARERAGRVPLPTRRARSARKAARAPR